MHHTRRNPDRNCQEIKIFDEVFYPKFLGSDQCLIIIEEIPDKVIPLK